MMNSFMKNKITVIGMWHLGCVYSASLAKLGYHVTCFDYDKKVITNLHNNVPPLYEPQLEETLSKYALNIVFTTDPVEACTGKDYIFITFDLPVDSKDRVDLSLIEEVIKTLKKNYDGKATIVISSQVPVGTCRTIQKALTRKGKEIPKVIYFPENLRLGKAFEAFLTPDRIVIGSDSEKALVAFQKDFAAIKTEFITMGLESAEMVKHALNAYLATCISYSSELSDICERVGGDMNDVVRALKTDSRVSPKAPLNPGLGFAGGTLGRDIQSLSKISRDLDYKAYLFPAVYKVNSNRLPEVIAKIKKLYSSLKGKKIGILGLTYKPGTNTLRRSSSLGLINLLYKEGADIRAYDPVINGTISGKKYLTICSNYDEFFNGLDAVVLMTEWPEFKDIDLKKVLGTMRKNVFIDTKNFYNKASLEKLGFIYKGIGLP